MRLNSILLYMCVLQLFNEVDRIHRSQKGFSDRFRGGFASVLTNVLQLAKGKSPIAKQYNEARQDALAEDLPGSHGHLAY